MSKCNAGEMQLIFYFFKKESDPMLPPRSQTDLLITIVAVQHVWRKGEERKFNFLETRTYIRVLV